MPRSKRAEKAKEAFAKEKIPKKLTRVVPDTSAIINEILSKKLISGELSLKELILPRVLLAELENQANKGLDIGFIGLDEINSLRELAKSKKFKLIFHGEAPTIEEIKLAKSGAIDAKIRNLAEELKATLITCDIVQAQVAKASGLSVVHFTPKITKELSFVKFFKPNYMSVHLKERETPRAKAGVPGNWEFIEISKKKITREELEKITEEIIEATRTFEDAFLEIERKGSIIAQIKNYRIVITRPPFSDAWEITIVRPVAKLSLDDYNLSEKVRERLRKQAEGILIAGAPGHGKTTFAQALAEDYAKQNKVVKTLEAPRDLNLPDNITQYALSQASAQEIHDILLLTRPDYTFFDEMRNTSDFKLFADMRLAGVGMVGVVHATNPIDAVQRFIGRVELGMIPHIIDTVIFIKNGKVHKVFSLSMCVKVPSGMQDEDLARPVVEVRDFETDELEYEIYTFGEATVVVPVIESKKTKRIVRWRLKETKKYFEFYFTTPARLVELYIDGEKLASLPLSRSREIRIYKKSKLGKLILEALATRSEIKFLA